MNELIVDQDQECILTYTIADEVLEVAACSAGNDRSMFYTQWVCTALLLPRPLRAPRTRVDQRRSIARRARAASPRRDRPHLQILRSGAGRTTRPNVPHEPPLVRTGGQQHRHSVMVVAHKLIGFGDHHRA